MGRNRHPGQHTNGEPGSHRGGPRNERKARLNRQHCEALTWMLAQAVAADPDLFDRVPAQHGPYLFEALQEVQGTAEQRGRVRRR